MASKPGNLFKNLYFTGLLISIGIVLIAYWFTFTTIFETIENKSVDQRFEGRGTVQGFTEQARVVIVGIDDQSIDNIPDNYPFPRAYYARFIQNMNRAGASAIGIDILFDGVDMSNTTSDSLLREVLLSYKNVVLAGRTETESVSGDRYDIKTSDSLYLRNIFYDIDAGVKLGLIYVPPDRDNIYRRYAITHQANNGQIFPTFAFEIVQYIDNIESGRNHNEFIINKTDETIQVGKYSAPNWDGYTVFLNYYGPAQTFTYIGLDKVLDDSLLITKNERINAEVLADEFGVHEDSVLADETLYNQWAEDLFDNSKMKRLASKYSLNSFLNDPSRITPAEKARVQALADEMEADVLDILQDESLYPEWSSRNANPNRPKELKALEDLTDEDLAAYDQLAILQSGVLKNKIVLVGSANPEDKDMLAIPMRKGDARQSNLTYGVEIHATAVQNLLDGNNVRPMPDWVLFLVLFIAAYTASGTSASGSRVRSQSTLPSPAG